MAGGRDDTMRVLEAIHRWREGVLRQGEIVTPIRFIIDGRQGRLIAAVARHVLDHTDGTLYIPDEGEDAAQLNVAISAADAIKDGEACDRWQAYHTRPTGPLWAQMRIEGARLGSTVLDEDEVDLRHPFVDDEARLCKELNARRDAVRAALARRKVDEPEPTVVGVDALGIDVRCRIGVVRVPFGGMVLTAEAARYEIGRIVG